MRLELQIDDDVKYGYQHKREKNCTVTCMFRAVLAPHDHRVFSLEMSTA